MRPKQSRRDIQTTLDIIFELREMTRTGLQQIATCRGLDADGTRRVLQVRIYQDMVELDGVIRFSCGAKL